MKEELLEFATKIWAKYGAEIWAKYGAEMGAKYRAEMGAEIWDTQVLPFTSLDEERALPDSLFERIRSLFFFDAHSLDRDRVWIHAYKKDKRTARTASLPVVTNLTGCQLLLLLFKLCFYFCHPLETMGTWQELSF
jgi:hypothetical protein